MTRIERLCAEWGEQLQDLIAGNADAAERYCLQIYDHLVKDLPSSRGQLHGVDDFAAVVDLIGKMTSVLPTNAVVALGVRCMMNRPHCPLDDYRNQRVEYNESTPKVIELFKLLSQHALDGQKRGPPNLMHLLRQILAQNAHHMTIEDMKPFLDVSSELTWAGRSGCTYLNVFHGPESVYFESESLLIGIGVDTLTNQAWAGLLYNCFEAGPSGGEVDDVLVGKPYAEPFDELMLHILQMAKAGVNMEVRRTDVVLVAQMLERMVKILECEEGTERAQHCATALQALVHISVPSASKITGKNCIYTAPGLKKNPMCDDGFYNICTLRSLKATAVPLAYPNAVSALEHFRYQVLLHAVHISPSLHKRDDTKQFQDDEYLRDLAELCSDKLMSPKALVPLSQEARLLLVKGMNEGPAKRKLMTDNLKIRKDIFVEDLGL